MEDISLLLQHDLSLKRLALTVLITNIYEDPVIKHHLQEKVLEWTKGMKSTSYSFYFQTVKKEIIKLASERVKLLSMPKSLISEALWMVIMIGMKITTWAKNVTEVLSRDKTCCDEIYWTNFGTIDEAKSFNTYWNRNNNFKKILEDVTDDYSYAFQRACIYGNEKAILYHQDVIIERFQKFLNEVNLPDIRNKVDQIAATYLGFMLEPEIFTQEMDVFQRFKQTGMVSISDAIMICRFNKNVKFLWKFLTDSEREIVKIEHARNSLYSALNFSSDVERYGRCDDDVEFGVMKLASCADKVHFLINQMTTEQKNEFLRKHASAVLQLFIQVWPYQEICVKLLKEDWVREVISEDGEKLWNILLSSMGKYFACVAVVLEVCMQETVFHQLLVKVFSLVPKKTKKLVLFNKEYYKNQRWTFPNAIVKFYQVFDVNSLSIIVNDGDLKENRDFMISAGSEKISELIAKGELKMIVRFAERVLINKDERKQFIKKWNLENHPLAADNPDIQEKILTWLRT